MACITCGVIWLDPKDCLQNEFIFVISLFGFFLRIGKFITVLPLSKFRILVFPSRLCTGPKGTHWLLNNLKADSRDITYSMTLSTKSSNQNFIVFLNEVQATITGHESCDLLAVLDELHLTHFLIAEFGCLASTPTFSSTIPLA